ncbi:MAG: STM4015 family protein [Blastocatellia bacterium]|nr:STM4015 family protein [Blastocatellia bacterium]
MTIGEHTSVFGGKSVVDWTPGTPLTNPEDTCFRITLWYEASEKGEEWTDLLAKFLEDPAAGRVYGIVVGSWSDMWEDAAIPGLEALVAARDQLTSLKALFLADVTFEECEISWIQQTDVTPLLEAYPHLEHFGVRGGQNLSFGKISHRHLKSLTIEAGGLGVEVVRAVLAADFPELEHLELWLGTQWYGATTELVDLAPLFTGRLFPKLKYLGLKNSDLSDVIATAIADSPLLERLEVLDLSMGTLGDEGAAALARSPAVKNLELLDLHHHYCSDEMMEKLQGLGIEVDVEGQESGTSEHRYVEVGE